MAVSVSSGRDRISGWAKDSAAAILTYLLPMRAYMLWAFVVAGVLVMALGGVAVEALDLAAHLGGSVEVCANRNGIGQFPGEGCQAFNVRVEAVQRGLPRGVALEHRGQVPLKLRVQFTAFF